MTVSKCIAGGFLTKSLRLHTLVLEGAEDRPGAAVGAVAEEQPRMPWW